MASDLNGTSFNRARAFMKLVARFFFRGEKLAEFLHMKGGERKNFVLSCLDDMLNAKFAAITSEDYTHEGQAEEEKKQFDSYAHLLNGFLNVDNICSFIWKDVCKQIPNPLCPFWDSDDFKELTFEEKFQINTILETFTLMAKMEMGMVVEPADFMPEVHKRVLKKGVPDFRQFNFDNPVISDFIENTPYRNVAAEVVHIVMWTYGDAVGRMADKGVRAEEADRIFRMFKEDIEPYFALREGLITSQQYIVRARSVFSLLCNEYKMLDLLADYDKISRGGKKHGN